MKAKELIEENNYKRRQLTKENLDYYEDMLVYVRLSFSKSEQETEEVLTELLDHLLQAQEEGKTAKDIFGSDPKQYARDIIGELPKTVTKENMQLFGMGVLYFLAAGTLLTGAVNLIMHYVFGQGELIKDYYLGTVAVKTGLSIPVAFCLLYIIVYYLRWSCFKSMNKVLEFIVFWLFGVFSLFIFMLVHYFVPDFGPEVSVPMYALLLIAAVFYAAARFTRHQR